MQRLDQHYPELSDFNIYISGPPAMVDAGTGTGNQMGTNINPLELSLMLLADNGGSTQTAGLSKFSPALVVFSRPGSHR